MKQGLDHLPDGKRRELEFVVGEIRDGFAKAIAHRTQSRFRTGKLLKDRPVRQLRPGGLSSARSWSRGWWRFGPIDTKFQKRSYELLRAAYVKARYSRHYRITAEELEWLGSRIDLLQGLIRAICEERIEALAAAA
jgi:hypothetical protein